MTGESAVLADTPSRKRRHGSDAWVWFAGVVGSIFWAGTARPLGDPDIWWHVRTGRLILDSGIPHKEPWAFTAIGRDWVPTAWLSDVVLAGTHDLLGWRGIVVLKVALSALLLLILARQLFSAASSRIAAPLFALTAITLSPFMAERPQLAALVLTSWLTSRVRLALDGRPIPWWSVAVAYLWANLHGMWVLFPLAMGALALGLTLDRRPGWRQGAARALTAGLAAVVAAALTPVGPRLAYWPLVVRDAASDISEWQPTVLASRFSLAFALLFLLWPFALARAKTLAPRSEIVWMLGVFLFSLQAGRNVAPAIVLMAPFVAVALQRAFGERLFAIRTPTVPRGLHAVTLTAAVSVTTFLCLAQQPLVDGLPFRMIDRLRDEPGVVRVLNSYNVGGALTGFGAPEVSVAIDGRTDNFEPAFVHRYLAATTKLVQWRKVVREVDADFAVLGKGGTLATELRHAGWERVMVDHDFVLLRAPNG